MPAITIPADHPGLRLTGRADWGDPRAPRFDWSGVSLSLRFRGGRLALLLDDGHNDYDAFVDGLPPRRIVTEPGRRSYALEGLGAGDHALRLVKRTEGYYGVATFRGVELPAGGQLLPPPPRPGRRLEFVGDSLTAGFGLESPKDACDDAELRAFENHDRCYAAECARRFGAEHHVVAVSGRGVVHNWGEPLVRSPKPLPAYYGQALWADQGPTWDFARFKPDAVVVFLGTNDIGQPEWMPSGPEFLQAYLDLLAAIRRANGPEPWIFCLSRAAAFPMAAWVRGAVERASAGDGRVSYVPLPDGDPRDMGASRHPNARGQEPWTAALADALRRTLLWDIQG